MSISSKELLNVNHPVRTSFPNTKAFLTALTENLERSRFAVTEAKSLDLWNIQAGPVHVNAWITQPSFPRIAKGGSTSEVASLPLISSTKSPDNTEAASIKHGVVASIQLHTMQEAQSHQQLFEYCRNRIPNWKPVWSPRCSAFAIKEDDGNGPLISGPLGEPVMLTVLSREGSKMRWTWSRPFSVNVEGHIFGPFEINKNAIGCITITGETESPESVGTLTSTVMPSMPPPASPLKNAEEAGDSGPPWEPGDCDYEDYDGVPLF